MAHNAMDADARPSELNLVYSQGRDDAYAYEGVLVEREPVDGGNVRLRLVARDARCEGDRARAACALTHIPM